MLKALHYYTLELDDINADRVFGYLQCRCLDYHLYYSEPHYRVCLVLCSGVDRSMLALLV
jgi:hypothetical protein